MPVEVGDRQSLQPREQRSTQIDHDVLPDPLHDLRLQVAQSEADGEHSEIERGDAIEMTEVAVPDPVIDRFLRKVGPDELRDRVRDHHHHGHDHLRPVRSQ